MGKAADNDIHLTQEGIGDHHATITLDGPHFTLRPAGSRQVLRLNGKKVKRKKVLEHGDRIQFGEMELGFEHLEDGSSDQNQHQREDTRDRRIEGLEQIHRLSRRLLQAAELDELLDDLMDSAIELTGASKGFLVLTDDETWNIQVARNIDDQALSDDDPPLSDSVLRQVIDTGEPLIVADARSDDQFQDSQSVIDLQLCSVLCVPLIDRGEILGVVHVGNDHVADLFDELDLELLSIFASQLSLVVANAILLDQLRKDKQLLKQRLQQRRFGSLIGASDAMEPVFHSIDRVAPTDVTVLITGETGTGKELVAGEIHRRSNRSDGPFITLNCGAIPADLLESELFGHEKGAFTGAENQKDGKFHAADGGTIFLDEIGEMPLGLQVKILRVLQERTVSRVGSNSVETVDIRILGATNRRLEEQVSDGKFREDLYYRLNVIEISLPPLRERGDDIVLIAHYLIDQICDELNIASRKLGRDAILAMRKYDWPGNVRQLENRLKKALVLARSATLGAEDLDLESQDLPEIQPLAEAKEQFALDYILQALEKNDGNRSQTARDLGVDPRTIFRYLEKSSS